MRWRDVGESAAVEILDDVCLHPHTLYLGDPCCSDLTQGTVGPLFENSTRLKRLFFKITKFIKITPFTIELWNPDALKKNHYNATMTGGFTPQDSNESLCLEKGSFVVFNYTKTSSGPFYYLPGTNNFDQSLMGLPFSKTCETVDPSEIVWINAESFVEVEN